MIFIPSGQSITLRLPALNLGRKYQLTVNDNYLSHWLRPKPCLQKELWSRSACM
jgi:hypothetical protein